MKHDGDVGEQVLVADVPDIPAADADLALCCIVKPGDQLEWLGASIETRHGKISSRWTHTDGAIRYEIVTPVPAQIVIGEKEYAVEPGKYIFWE